MTIHAEDIFIEGPAGPLATRVKGLEPRPREVVILVQGSNMTGQAMFDFQWSGGDDYSVMDALVARGLGAITFSIRGYGKSTAPADPFSVTTETAMEDFDAIVRWVAEKGWPRPHILAFSWGGRIAGRWAEDNADRLGRLVLYDPARGGGQVILPAPTDPWWVNSREFYAERLEPEFTDMALARAIGDYIVEHEPRAPNGIRLENAVPVKAIDPTRVTSPTLLIYGVEAAKAAYMHGGLTRQDFFEQLDTDDKAFVIVPKAGDFAHFQAGRHRLLASIVAFLQAEG